MTVAAMRTTDLGELLAAAVSSSRHEGVSPDDLRRCHVELIERAGFHRVPGPLLTTFDRHGIDGVDRLRDRAMDDAMSRLSMLYDLDWLGQIFGRERIDFLVFKGPVLTTIAGRDRWERPALDLDVLVRGVDLERAIDSLVDAGAVHLDRNWVMMLAKVIGEVHLILPTGTSLDLHWNLLVNESMRSVSSPDHVGVFDTCRPIDLDGLVVSTFGAAETLVYSCVHACISGGHRLVWLKDIEQLVLEDAADWPDVIDVARTWGASLQVGAMLGRTRRHLGLDVPSEVIESLLPNRALRRALAELDDRRSVADATSDESLLRLSTRSLGPDTATTARRFALRSLAFARRRTFRRKVMSATVLFEDHPGEDARRRYLDAVVAASS